MFHSSSTFESIPPSDPSKWLGYFKNWQTLLAVGAIVALAVLYETSGPTVKQAALAYYVFMVPALIYAIYLIYELHADANKKSDDDSKLSGKSKADKGANLKLAMDLIAGASLMAIAAAAAERMNIKLPAAITPGGGQPAALRPAPGFAGL